MEAIRTSYGNEGDDNHEDVEETLIRMITNDEEIDLLQIKIADAHEQRARLIQNLKKTYIESVSTAQIVRCALRYFDEEGKILGFENVVLSQIREKTEDDADDIVDVIRETVFRLWNELGSQVPILKRRYTLHLMASVFQLQELENLEDHPQLENALKMIFEYLCQKVHDWTQLSSFEKEFLYEMTERFNDVPETVKNWIKNLIV